MLGVPWRLYKRPTSFYLDIQFEKCTRLYKMYGLPLPARFYFRAILSTLIQDIHDLWIQCVPSLSMPLFAYVVLYTVTFIVHLYFLTFNFIFLFSETLTWIALLFIHYTISLIDLFEINVKLEWGRRLCLKMGRIIFKLLIIVIIDKYLKKYVIYWFIQSWHNFTNILANNNDKKSENIFSPNWKKLEILTLRTIKSTKFAAKLAIKPRLEDTCFIFKNWCKQTTFLKNYSNSIKNASLKFYGQISNIHVRPF